MSSSSVHSAIVRSVDITPKPHGDSALLKNFMLNNVKAIELIGVVMRIGSFSLVSWMGPESPFLFVWVFNTIDAILLSWAALTRRDLAYSLLNIFWIGVGVVGIMRAMPSAH